MVNKNYASKKEWKKTYFERLEDAIRAHSKFLLVNADNVSSKQFAEIRVALRGKATIVMGKNTMMKKCIGNLLTEFPEYEKILPLLVKNVGFIFTNEDLSEVRDIVAKHKVAAPGKQGTISPFSVVVPAQNSGQGPEKTSFFQALSIPTRIARGTIEITSDVHLLKPGDKVGASEAALLNMLKIKPFSYGLVVKMCYDEGSVFEPGILDITSADIRTSLMAGVVNIAAVSLKIGYPTTASVPHSISNGLRKLIAVAATTEINFPTADNIKAFLANPSAFIVEEAKNENVAVENAVVSDSDSDDDSDFGIGFGFGGEDGDSEMGFEMFGAAG